MFISFPLDNFKYTFQSSFQLANNRLLLYSKDEIVLITLLSGKQISRNRILAEPHQTFLKSSLSPSGGTLAIINDDGSLRLFRPESDEDSLWKPWKPIQSIDDFKACSCFFKDETNLLIGFSDGTLCSLKVGSRPTKPRKLTEFPITLICHYLAGCSNGDLFDIETGAKVESNSCMNPTILDSTPEYTLIAKFNSIFLFHRESVVKSFQLDEQVNIIGGGINPFLICTSNGNVYSCESSGNLVNIETYGGYKIHGFVANPDFKAMLASNAEENTLLVSDNFIGAELPRGKEYLESELAVFSGKEVDSAALSYFLLGNRCIHLTDHSLHILRTIASTKREGILQPELSKLLGIEAKMTFHHIKPLLKFGLISKYPVSSNKTFTYLNVHWRFVEEDFSIDYTSAQVHLNVASLTVQQLITKTLERAPNFTLTSKELFQLCGLEIHMLKIFRRCLVVLSENGKIEYIRGSELGQRDNLIRLKKSKENEPSEVEIEEEQEEADDSIHIQGLPIGLQLYRYIAARGVGGATAREIMSSFGVNSKLVNRLLEKFVGGKDPFGKDAIKQPEFFGKERRYKYMIRGSIDPPKTPIPSVAVSPQLGHSLSRDSVTRVQRQELIINLLKEEGGIIEVSKGLAARMAALLQAEHMIDVKTLRRYVLSLEEQGFVKTVAIKFQNISKHLAYLPSASQDQIDRYIDNFKKNFKFGPSQIVIEEDSASSLQTELLTVDKFELGFIFGSMARIRYLHKYLLDVGKPDHRNESILIVDSITAMFKDLPLKAFSALCGFEQAEQRVVDALKSDCNLHISEFKINPRRLRSVLGKLLALLSEYNLVENEASSLMSVPVTIRVKTQVDNYRFPEDFENYWRDLEHESIYPERFYLKPLSTRERRALKRENFEKTLFMEAESPVTERMEGVVANNPTPIAGEKQFIHVYSEGEDHEFYVASLIGFHFREKYAAFIANISKLPFRLIAIALYSPSTAAGLSQASLEVRRRIKNLGQNTTERRKVKIIEKNLFFIKTMMKLGLLPHSYPTSSPEDFEKSLSQVIADSDEEKHLILEFKAELHFFLVNLERIGHLREMLGRYHESKPLDLDKLQEIQPADTKSLVDEFEMDSHVTRSELVEEYYSKAFVRRETIHPQGFERIRDLIVKMEDGEVPIELVEYAIKEKLLIPSTPSRCDIVINDQHFEIPDNLFFDPSSLDFPSNINEIGDDSNLEGLLTLMAVGRVRIDPKTLDIDASGNEKSPLDALTLSWLSGRYGLLSSRERELLKDNLLNSQ